MLRGCSLWVASTVVWASPRPSCIPLQWQWPSPRSLVAPGLQLPVTPLSPATGNISSIDQIIPLTRFNLLLSQPGERRLRGLSIPRLAGAQPVFGERWGSSLPACGAPSTKADVRAVLVQVMGAAAS